MKQYNALLFCAFISVVICFSACSNSTAIGADLLESDRQDIQFSEDFVMQTSTQLGDSVRTFNPTLSAQLSDYLVGEYQDPIFGMVRSSVYAQVSKGITGNPDFEGNILDSVVLVLPYRTAEEYGNINTEYTIDILRIDDPSRFGEFDNPLTESLWSDVTFETQSTPLGSKTFVPNSVDSMTILTPKQDTLGFDETKVAPQLRIPLNMDFATELFDAEINMPEDSVFFSDDKFTKYLNGLHITSTTENEGLLDFGIRSNSDAGIFVYYRRQSTTNVDSTNNFYQFLFSADDIKTSNYKIDYTGSIVETFVNDPALGDSLFFVQGLNGVNGTLKFPNLDNLRGDIAINKAELVFTVAELPEDLDIYELPLQFLLSEIDEEGELNLVEDAFSITVFDGELTEYTDRLATYSMNITAHLQNVLKGTATDELIVTISGTNSTPNRAVLCGGGHSTSPVKLLVHYTQF